MIRSRKAADEERKILVEHLKSVRYFWKQAHWLTTRFPDAELGDIEGLVKLVDLKEIQDYLGHKNITHTVKYTRTASSRFENLWR